MRLLKVSPFMTAAVGVAALSVAGCTDSVQQNLAAGLRDGTLTAVGGILEDFFNARFGLGEEGAEEEGNERFIRL